MSRDYKVLEVRFEYAVSSSTCHGGCTRWPRRDYNCVHLRRAPPNWNTPLLEELEINTCVYNTEEISVCRRLLPHMTTPNPMNDCQTNKS